jgi:hypothetical protein
MHSSTIINLLAFAVSQVSAQYYANQSAPFALVVKSHNSTLNGSALYPCHEGAAIEGLCLGGKFGDGSSLSSYTYNLNYSSQAQPDPVIGITGLLTWELHGANFNLSSPMQFSYNPGSNVAVPLFEPSESGTFVGFDTDNKMFINQGLDDTVVPPAYVSKPIYRWAICKTNVGYYYTTLAWIMGPGHAENPTCQKVDIVRVFV